MLNSKQKNGCKYELETSLDRKGVFQVQNFSSSGRSKNNKAVIIADSFDECFMPLTRSTPRAMLKIFNKPLIEYTIESLIESQITDIIIMVCSHANLIKNYFRNYKKYNIYDVRISIITTKFGSCISMGDALRELEFNFKHLILNDDFILVNGFLITNFNFLDLLNEQTEKRKNEPDVLLTVLYSEKNIFHKNNNLDDLCVTLVNEPNRQLLWTKKISKSTVRIPFEYMDSITTAQLHTNYFKTNIFACSPKILETFADEFDYQSMDQAIEKQLMILDDEEIIKTRFRIFYQTSSSYILNVSNIKCYFNAIFDLIHSHVNIFNPIFLGYQANYDFVYFGKNVSYKLSKLFKSNYIGDNTVIEENQEITYSSIGSNCKIRKNVKIDNCILWDNVQIGVNCIIRQTIVGDNVFIGNEVIIGENCIICSNIKIPDGTIIEPKTLLTTFKKEDFENYTSVFTTVELTEIEHVYKYNILDSNARYYLWGDNALKIDKEVEELIKLEDQDQDKDGDDSSTSNLNLSESDDFSNFENEVEESVLIGITTNKPVDAIIIEINSTRYSHNIALEDCLLVVFEQCLKTLIPVDSETKADDELMKTYKEYYERIFIIIENYSKSKTAKTCLMRFIEKHCYLSRLDEKRKVLVKFYIHLLNDLYNSKILDEDDILEFYNEKNDLINEDDDSTETDLDQSIKMFRKTCLHQLIEWLEDSSDDC